MPNGASAAFAPPPVQGDEAAVCVLIVRVAYDTSGSTMMQSMPVRTIVTG
jgi:hypothetical protein